MIRAAKALVKLELPDAPDDPRPDREGIHHALLRYAEVL